ncbi:MAG: hypothetical protein A2Y53_00450 [Chloroflexi bacterium RBG_16_47_49]|nr:MAG: hypothetical protein A2Y53_00450 [Chloroflexi bacterium RBG_16_47_49]
MSTQLKSHLRRFPWASGRDYLFITIGTLLQALSIRLFLVPGHLVNGGISGLAQIINFYTKLPIGVMILICNIPLLILGWRHLGGRRFAIRTAYAVVTVSFFTDILVFLLPDQGLSSDLVLNTLYGGVISGIGYGLVYRGHGTSGGTDILVRIIINWRAIPISQSYLITDSLIMLLGGLAYSWRNALYAIIMLFISGIAAEITTEGPNVVRTAIIITANPDQVSQSILIDLERGVTAIHATGVYTGSHRAMLYCVITRSEVSVLKSLVLEADPGAFIVIGQANEVLGEGFRPLQQ